MKALSKEELQHIRKAGLILRECLKFLAGEIREGISTECLDEKARSFIESRGGKPAFLGYKGFPASICASKNNIVVHGIPKAQDILRSGDIVSIDVGVDYCGYFSDGAKTFAVGEILESTKRLITVTRDALYKGIEKATTGNRVHDISYAIQSFVESNGFSVVRVFVGHGIGKNIHEAPEIPNFGKRNNGVLLEEGMVLAIEPMVNEGTHEVEILDDGWTAVTKDQKLSAHFEHTIIVRKKKAEIIT